MFSNLTTPNPGTALSAESLEQRYSRMQAEDVAQVRACPQRQAGPLLMPRGLKVYTARGHRSGHSPTKAES